MKGHGKVLFLAALTFGVALAARPVSAAAQGLFDPKNTCTGINCNSQTVTGFYSYDNTTNRSNPFVVQIYSQGNECVRLDVLQQNTDLEIVLVSPAGEIWRNDDSGSGACNLCPLVKALTSSNGWHTLQVSHYAAGAGTAQFRLQYGRYNAGNVNCSPATPVERPEREALKLQ